MPKVSDLKCDKNVLLIYTYNTNLVLIMFLKIFLGTNIKTSHFKHCLALQLRIWWFKITNLVRVTNFILNEIIKDNIPKLAVVFSPHKSKKSFIIITFFISKAAKEQKSRRPIRWEVITWTSSTKGCCSSLPHLIVEEGDDLL